MHFGYTGIRRAGLFFNPKPYRHLPSHHASEKPVILLNGFPVLSACRQAESIDSQVGFQLISIEKLLTCEKKD
jgi:hypothetical protein